MVQIWARTCSLSLEALGQHIAGFANQGYLPSTPLEVLPKRSSDANEALLLKTGSHQYAKLLDELDEHLSALSGCKKNSIWDI